MSSSFGTITPFGFNNATYDTTRQDYNVSFPMYIDGSGANSIPINGINDYSNKFGKVMASFVIDKGDTILGGNVIISNQLSLYDNINLGTNSNILINGVTILPTEMSYLDGATSNLQTQITAKLQRGDIDAAVSPINTLLFGNLGAITTGRLNYSVGSDNTYALNTGTGNTLFGRNILTSSASASNNVCYGNYILQNFNPSSLIGNNVGFGNTLMQALTTGISNVAVGQSILSSITTSQMNTAIGNLSGTRILGNFNTCIGAQTGQPSGNFSTFNNSTAIGYNAQITSSNQIILGTSVENVYCPNTLNVSTSISIGVNTLSSTLWGYLTGITSSVQTQITNVQNQVNSLTSSVQTQINNIQTQINSSTSYTGRVIQMRIHSNLNSTIQTDRFTGIVSNTVGDYTIYQTNFLPKSSSSQVHITFDSNYGLTGSGFDEWNSKIYLNPNTGASPTFISYRNVKYGMDNRYSQVTLFPISAAYSNTALNVLSFYITVGAQDSNDGLSINGNWNMTVTEIQN